MENDSVKEYLAGKYLSVLGDSISTRCYRPCTDGTGIVDRMREVL